MTLTGDLVNRDGTGRLNLTNTPDSQEQRGLWVRSEPSSQRVDERTELNPPRASPGRDSIWFAHAS